MNVVVVRDFSWKYPNFTGIKSDFVLKNINLEVSEGEFLGITGRSGSGKTTLCYSIAGLIPHQLKIPEDVDNHIKGSVEVLGELVGGVKKSGDHYEVDGVGSMAPAVGFVMQDPESQFLSMSMLHEVSIGLQMMGLDKDEIEQRITDALEMVGLGQYRNVAYKIHPSELSGGQKQRLIIASFLAMKPRVLILDEPTSDLDPAGKMEVIGTIADLKKKTDMTIILVEHNPDVMLKFADRIAIMYNGEIVETGKPSDLYAQPNILRKYSVYMPDVSELSDYFSLDGEPKVKIDDSSYIPARKSEPKTEKIIDVRKMSFTYPDGTRALEDISININKGEMVALVGQNGSGKSTLSKVLSGIVAPTTGLVTVAGISATEKAGRKQLPLHVGYVFQNPDHQIFTRSVRDELDYGLGNIGVRGEEAEKRITETLSRVGLADKYSEDPMFLGRGQKRRLAVASSIVMKPDILIVDEPTTGQDYRMSKDIMELLTDLNLEGTTVLIITHDMRLVAEYCRRVIVMGKGTLVFDGTPESLFMDEDILAVAALAEPQSVRISKELVRKGYLKGPLISAREWLQFFNFLRLKSSFEFCSYTDMEQLTRDLVGDIVRERGKPSGILYVERGGMVPAYMLLGELPGVETFRIRASYYSDLGAASSSVEIYNIPSALNNISGGYLLVVDEIVDSGKTMQRISTELKKRTGVDIVTATVLLKKGASFIPDFYAKLMDSDTWIVLEYEKNETLRSVAIKRPEDLEQVTSMFPEDKSVYGEVDTESRNAAEKIREVSGRPGLIVYLRPEAMLFARVLSDALSVSNVVGVSGPEELSDASLEGIGDDIVLVGPENTQKTGELLKLLSEHGKVQYVPTNGQTSYARDQ